MMKKKNHALLQKYRIRDDRDFFNLSLDKSLKSSIQQFKKTIEYMI